jgi:HlyD family secretion protein
MKKWLTRALVVVGIVAVVAFLKATVFAPKPIEVETVTVATGSVESTITNSRAGTIKARRRAKLSPEFGGQVARLPFREGDRVQAGEIVLELDSSLQRARHDLARRELEAALSQAEQACFEARRAGQKAERTQRLAEDEIVSTDLLDEIETGRQAADAACQAARSTADRARAAVALAQAELDKTRLRTPFDGIVADLTTEVGEWVTPSPPALPVPPVIDILDPGSIYISAPMDEVDSASIRVGLPARVTIDSHRDREFAGTVSRVAAFVLDLEEQNRTVEIEVELEDAELAATLLPGTSADVEVILTVEEGVLRIPTAALMEGNRVLVLADGVLEERAIEPGLRNWDFTQVVSGLEEGEQLVTSLDRPEIQAGDEAVAASPEG